MTKALLNAGLAGYNLNTAITSELPFWFKLLAFGAFLLCGTAAVLGSKELEQRGAL